MACDDAPVHQLDVVECAGQHEAHEHAQPQHNGVQDDQEDGTTHDACGGVEGRDTEQLQHR